MNSLRKQLPLIGILLLAIIVGAAAGLYFDLPARLQRPRTADPAQPAYNCPMHPDVVRDHPGDCPKCGMALVATGAAASSHADCDHESASGGCCPQPAATRMRLPAGHPPFDASSSNGTGAAAGRPTS